MKLYRIPMPRDESMIPDFAALAGVYRKVHAGVRSGNIRFATVVENGGIAAAVAKSCLGNGFGFRFEGEAADLLGEQYGELIVSLADPSALDCDKILLGETTEDGTFVCGGASVSQQEAVEAFCGTLEKVFPNHAAASGAAEAVDFDCCGKRYENIATKTAKPRVFIPVFPGTNCELDTARMFRLAGAECEEVVVRNRSAADIEESVRAIAAAIGPQQHHRLPGRLFGRRRAGRQRQVYRDHLPQPVHRRTDPRPARAARRPHPRHLQRLPGAHQARPRAVRRHPPAHTGQRDADLQQHLPPRVDARRYPRGVE